MHVVVLGAGVVGLTTAYYLTLDGHRVTVIDLLRPAPTGDPDAPLQALIFDSQYDQYRGVVSSLRVMNGRLRTGMRIRFMQAATIHDVDEIGARLPVPTPLAELGPGEVGYLIAGIKDVGEARSGETVTGSQSAPEAAGICGRNFFNQLANSAGGSTRRTTNPPPRSRNRPLIVFIERTWSRRSGVRNPVSPGVARD